MAVAQARDPGVAYFAYGSNMSLAQLQVRCPSAVVVGAAALDGYRLAFAGHSKTWGAGAATVRPEAGARTQGRLFRLTMTDLERLDAAEGLGTAYECLPLPVAVAGGEVTAEVYLKPAAAPPAAPTAAYFEQIRSAYAELGFDGRPLFDALAAPRSAPAPEGLCRVFVYGTLRRGEGNHRLLSRSRFLGVARTAPSFDLFDLGAFPALVTGGATSVEGELFDVDPATLAALDRLEGHPDLYRRTPLSLDDGTAAAAYLMPRGGCREHPVLASGRWPPDRP